MDVLIETGVEVLIDGVRYIPVGEIPERTDEAVLKAVQELVSLIHLHGPLRGRSINGCVWSALRALAPDIANIAENDTGAAFLAVHPDSG